MFSHKETTNKRKQIQIRTMNLDDCRDNEKTLKELDRSDVVLRKVQSLGCVRPVIRKDNNIQLNSKTCSRTEFDAKQVASKFSISASSGTGNDNNMDYNNYAVNNDDYGMNNSCAEMSLKSGVGRKPLAIVEERSDQSTPVRRYCLSMSRRLIGYVSVVLLIIATISNSNLDLVHAHGHSGSSIGSSSTFSSSTSKLGPAALSSLTTVLSPILPFTGGADLRRGETILDLLPTGTFDTFEAFHSYDWGGLKITDSLNMWKSSDYIESESKRFEATKGVPRGGAVLNEAVQKKERLALRKKMDSQPSIIAAAEPFVPSEVIAQLTLEELGDVFHFTIMHNSEGFNREYLSTLSPAVRQVIQGIENVASQLRGSGVLPTSTRAKIDDKGKLSDNGYGDVDALSFLALMRVFAEWRVFRQVPDGYRGYAVGMNLGHKDVVQNLAKVELAVLVWIIERRDFVANENIKIERLIDDSSNGENENLDKLVLRSPTLRDLLQYEIDIDLHDGKLPSLKEKSAGMGLLWVRRQLHYQLAIYSNMDSGIYSNTIEAVTEAYKEVYHHYHGWAVQKIFNYSFQAAPDSKEIFKMMNPNYLQMLLAEGTSSHASDSIDVKSDIEVSDSHESIQIKYGNDNICNNIANENQTVTSLPVDDEARTSHANIFVQGWNHIGSEWNKASIHIHSESDKLGKHIHEEWDKLGNHVQNEWIKIASKVCDVLKINNKNKSDHDLENVDFSSNYDVRGGGERSAVSRLEGEALEQFILDKLTHETHRQISVFLQVSKPLLEDLSGLFDEMNMNDPKKV